MTGISIHVVDCMHGHSAPGVQVRLEHYGDNGWASLATGSTVDDGGVPAIEKCDIQSGRHRLTLLPASYFAGLGSTGRYHEFVIEFQVTETGTDLGLTIYVSPASFAAYWRQG
jgi:5-hydroxyisourate hydrolase